MKPPTSLLLLLVLILVLVALHYADCRLMNRHLSEAYQSVNLRGSKNYVSVHAGAADHVVPGGPNPLHNWTYILLFCFTIHRILLVLFAFMYYTCPIIMYVQFDQWKWCSFSFLYQPTFLGCFLTIMQFTCKN